VDFNFLGERARYPLYLLFRFAAQKDAAVIAVAVCSSNYEGIS
jgi:hypothetical protein